MSISIAQAVAYARMAGFSGEALVTIVAIAIAESGLDPTAQGPNGPTAGCPNGSLDRGLLQINSCYHSEVSDAQAYDPVGAFQAGWAISAGGLNFQPWTTYTGGHYQAHAADVRAAVSSSQDGGGGGGGAGGGGSGEGTPGGTGLSAAQVALLAALLVLALAEG